MQADTYGRDHLYTNVLVADATKTETPKPTVNSLDRFPWHISQFLQDFVE